MQSSSLLFPVSALCIALSASRICHVKSCGHPAASLPVITSTYSNTVRYNTYDAYVQYNSKLYTEQNTSVEMLSYCISGQEQGDFFDAVLVFARLDYFVSAQRDLSFTFNTVLNSTRICSRLYRVSQLRWESRRTAGSES